jgi:hypothetical protein
MRNFFRKLPVYSFVITLFVPVAAFAAQAAQTMANCGCPCPCP